MPAAKGARYVADVVVELVNVPQLDPEQPLPDADQVTPAFPTSFCTVAVTASACVAVKPPRFGEIVTLTLPTEGVTVIVALAFFVLSETDVAVSVTAAGLGTLLGALYVIGVPEALELADSVPQLLPLHPAPESVQRTPRCRLSFRTVAVNCCVPVPACTLALVGDTLTLMRVCAALLGALRKAQSPNAIIPVVTKLRTEIQFE
jgi:hypothetical protein